MNQNSLIEIGSKAHVILRFKSGITLNGKTYAAGEPYLYLKDVNVIVNYTNQDKSGSAVKTIIANSEIKPKSVMIGGVSFSRKLAALLACFKETNADYNYTVFEVVVADGQDLYLAKTLDSTTDWFVYDEDYNKISGSTYNSISNSISNINFEDGETYFVSYSSVKQGTKFSLNKPSVPYMSLEIQGIGNIDKTTKNVVMYFDKVSLNSLIQFTFIQNDMINVPLDFHIIDDSNNYVVFED